MVVESGSADAGALPQELQGARVRRTQTFPSQSLLQHRPLHAFSSCMPVVEQAVTPEWLTNSLAARQQQPEAQYEPQAKPAGALSVDFLPALLVR